MGVTLNKYIFHQWNFFFLNAIENIKKNWFLWNIFKMKSQFKEYKFDKLTTNFNLQLDLIMQDCILKMVAIVYEYYNLIYLCEVSFQEFNLDSLT